MTATDELRRILDERGVEYEADDDATRFFGPDGFEVVMQKDIDGKLDCLTPLYLTPAQAIAATLGATDANPTQAESSGTCKRVMDSIDPFAMWVCDHCGHPLDTSENFCGGCGRKVVDA